MSKGFLVLLLPALVFLSSFSSSIAAWAPNGNPVCTAAQNQFAPAIISDGQGGAIITWWDFRSGSGTDIFAQRVDASGNMLWAFNGAPVCTVSGNQSNPKIIPDEVGGAIIVWQDSRFGLNDIDIFAQRLDASGNVMWPDTGVAISVVIGREAGVVLAPDDSGGVIVAWSDFRDANRDIYAQRVSAGGTVLWKENGVELVKKAGTQTLPAIVPDGLKGAIVSWTDADIGNGEIFAQRISASGTILWALNGNQVSTGANLAGVAQGPRMVPDGQSGAIITWEDRRTEYDIYAQHVNFFGTVTLIADVPVCDVAGTQNQSAIAPDGQGGAIITWRDFRNNSSPTGNRDIYAQRLSITGNTLWTSGGNNISIDTTAQDAPAIAAEGAGGAIIAWYDFRNDPGGVDIFAQRVNSAGVEQWTNGGVAISTAADHQFEPTLTSDGQGGAIFAWEDHRNGLDPDIYANRYPDGVTAVDEILEESPSLRLLGNWPNPFAARTTLRFV